MGRATPHPTLSPGGRGGVKKAAILFDADHTLFDTDRAEARSLRAALGRLSLPWSRSVLATYRAINVELWAAYRRGEVNTSTLAHERFRRLLEARGWDTRRARALGRAYLAEMSRRGDLLPGVRRTLAALRRDHLLGLVTNGIDRVQRSRLRAARLERVFDAVVTSEECGFTKPDPRILEVALARLGVRAQDAVYVGDDADADAGAAQGAGVPFLWVDRGRPLPEGVRRPARRLDGVSELLSRPRLRAARL